ncbi:hypothetical protein MRB53_010708 [Persea americana]|uniref:Uncharacterized protein n=1 Tax=Persea americana TaxID=3435 RepID=A0ACC2LTR2_PERAE|nr:hypothetical protein MRB53_010708 [Persea americana]
MTNSSVSTNRYTSYLVPKIASLVSVKLENHNCLLWRSQFLPVLRTHGMLGFVDGSNPCPDEFIASSSNQILKEVNPQFLTWIQQDQVVLCLINATLLEGVLAHVIELQTSRDVWLALERRFASLSHSYIIQLKSQLQSIKKGPLSIDDYVKKIKHIVDSLAACEEMNLDFTSSGLTDTVFTAMVVSKEGTKNGSSHSYNN